MPIPSSTYFPRSLQEQAAWYLNFMNNFTAALATSLGFSVAERGAIENDQMDFQQIAETQASLDAFASAFRQYRISVTEDPVGTPTPVFPNEDFQAPTVGVPAGIFQRLIQTVERIRAHPNYTDETGASLGIKPAPAPPSFVEPDASPSLKVDVQPDNQLLIKFVKGGSDGIRLEMQVDNETDWKPAGTFFKSPANLAIDGKSDGLPRAVRLRARFLDGNTPTGQFSDTVNLVTTP